uniref:Uncharacterized protein n=1 Tax=Hippocampus comes TaxID=109280 RepID=A0A3Q3E3W8_HIPCM
MESGVFLPFLDQFMMSPLVTWVKTFVSYDEGRHVDFSELLDGVFLNEVMSQIHPAATPHAATKLSKDPSQRVQNLTFLVQQIKTYYVENLRQLILIPLPNVLLLSRTPYTGKPSVHFLQCLSSLEQADSQVSRRQWQLTLDMECTLDCQSQGTYRQTTTDTHTHTCVLF